MMDNRETDEQKIAANRVFFPLPISASEATYLMLFLSNYLAFVAV